MGKSKGGGRKAFMKGKAADSDEEEAPAMRQSNNAGMMPPSDSEEEEEEVEKKKVVQKPKVVEKPKAGNVKSLESESEEEEAPELAGQNRKAGMMPPSDSEEEDDDDDEEDAPPPKLISKPAPVVEKTAKEISVDMARLALVRKRREDERISRIEKDGVDVFKAVGANPVQARLTDCPALRAQSWWKMDGRGRSFLLLPSVASSAIDHPS
eukprot:CAMPEP_0198199158 /NCGR_PEP_ID=MMETSP1445-20131203/2479_1 /TAXON_ID=36898 /ORGANISM="Pyramimonas sp., Strain CCMP2087" /LENGTH=209 /DNA_ID=CAMNT_0043868911 /DNA_START=54 /DNA_END=681 /DNA_ORIENTATION=+